MMQPPDFAELDCHPINDEQKYWNFYRRVIAEITAYGKPVCVINTDRKFKNTVISKHSKIEEIFKKMDFDLITHKIWVKSMKVNFFRLNYAHIMVYAKGKIHQNRPKSFWADVFDEKDDRFGNFKFGMPTKISEILIENFTKENETVFDPFMGSGTTAIACINTNRKYIGSEIDPDVYNLSLERINSHQRMLRL